MKKKVAKEPQWAGVKGCLSDSSYTYPDKVVDQMMNIRGRKVQEELREVYKKDSERLFQRAITAEAECKKLLDILEPPEEPIVYRWEIYVKGRDETVLIDAHRSEEKCGAIIFWHGTRKVFILEQENVGYVREIGEMPDKMEAKETEDTING